MPRSRLALMLTVVGRMMILSSCAAGPNTLAGGDGDAAGFWLGLWHGLISPITFIVSLFNSQVNIYEVRNNGNWYDFGFVLGAMMALGGGGAGARGRRKRRRTRHSHD